MTPHIQAGDGLIPYVKNNQVFVCPSESQGKQSGDSYAYNNCLVRRTSTGFNPGQSLAAFASPASWMLLGEEASISQGEEHINTEVDSTDDGYFNLEFGNVFSTRHLDGSCLVFLDGHCKAYKTLQIVANGFQTGGAGGSVCPQ